MAKSLITNTSKQFEISLRPKTLEDYLGQEEIKQNLRVFITSALQRKEVLDHILLFGPPGLGKTTMAYIVANEMGSKLHFVNASSVEKTGEMAAILSTIEPFDILFIDEIHRLPKVVEELLYSAMEDFKLSIVISHDNDASSLTIDLPPFTLIGATTKHGDLSWPLRTRFGITAKINFYKVEEIEQILKRTARVIDIGIDDDAAHEIAIRSRGTPRIANILMKRVRDFAICKNKKTLDLALTINALDSMKVDPLGLQEVDINYLDNLINRFDGGPVGLETISSSIGEVSSNIEEVYEPYLLSLGFINRTQRGRVVTEIGRNHFQKYHSN